MTMLFILLFSTVPASAQGPPLGIGLSLFPPYAYKDDQGRTAGLSVEYLSSLMEELQISHRFFFIPLQRLRYAFAEADVDLMLGTAAQYSRNEEYCIMSNNHILEMSMRLYAHDPNELALLPDEGALKLSEIRVGQMRAYTFLGAVDTSRAQVIYADSHTQLMNMLQAGKIDIVIDYRVPAELALEELKITDLVSLELLTVPLHILLRRDFPDSQTIMQKLDQLIEKGEAPQLPPD